MNKKEQQHAEKCTHYDEFCDGCKKNKNLKDSNYPCTGECDRMNRFRDAIKSSQQNTSK